MPTPSVPSECPRRILSLILILFCVGALVLGWSFISDRQFNRVAFHRGFLDRLDAYRTSLADEALDKSMEVAAVPLQACASHAEVVWYRSQKVLAPMFDADVANAQGAQAFDVCMRQHLDDLAPMLDKTAHAKLNRLLR
jgi:hypothetical protein